jgi:probable rRNA maturation factor
MIKFEVHQQAGRKIPPKFWRQGLNKIAQSLKIKKTPEISIAVVDERTIKKLNRLYRDKNQVTDVLSFAETNSKIKFDKNYLGEIVICYPQAVRQAKKVGHSVNKEIELLLIHGFLHLLGYDHQKKKETRLMRSLEQKILTG